jgi:hypothetical protein
MVAAFGEKEKKAIGFNKKNLNNSSFSKLKTYINYLLIWKISNFFRYIVKTVSNFDTIFDL